MITTHTTNAVVSCVCLRHQIQSSRDISQRFSAADEEQCMSAIEASGDIDPINIAKS